MIDARPVGLTGAIAGGKSTVLAMLADLGLRTASSDAVARDIFADDAIQAAIRSQMGGSGPVQPSELRKAILEDPSLRRWTNRLIHPLVGERLSSMDVDVVEVPLLFEACLQGRYREVWTASCGAVERERRIRSRYGTDADVRAFGTWQLDEGVKDALADKVVRTDLPFPTVLSLVVAEAARCFPGRIAHPG